MSVVIISTEINVKLGEFFAYFLINQFKFFLHKLVPLLMWRDATQEKGILFDDCRQLIALDNDVGFKVYVILYHFLQAFNLAALIAIRAAVLVGDVYHVLYIGKRNTWIFCYACRCAFVKAHHLTRVSVVRHNGLALRFVE